MNKFVNKLITSGKQQTPKEIEEFVSELLVAGAADSGVQVAAITSQVFKDQERDKSSPPATANADSAMAAELATLQQQVQAQQQQLGAAYGSVGFGGQQGYVPQFQPNPNLYAGSVSPGSWASNAMTTLTLDSRQPNFNMQFGGQAGSFQAPQFLQGYAQMPFAFNTQMQQQPGPYCSGGGGPGMQHINLFAIEEKPVSETQMEEPTAVEPSDEIDSTPTPMTEVTQLQGLQAINAIEAIKRQCCTTSTFDVVCNVY